MRLFIRTEVFSTITSDADVTRLRDAVGRQIARIKESGKLELGWVASDARSPMFIVNVDSATEVSDLFGGAFIDHFHVECHPIMSLEQLGEFFVKHPPGR